MIKLENIKIENFLSYKQLDKSFDKGLFLIDGYNYDEDTANGSGKSSLIDAICFALYGDLPRSVKVEEIISWGENRLIVQLKFRNGKDNYFINRGRNPNVLDFYVNGVIKNGKDSRETQQIITGVIGVSLNTFLSSVYYSQNQGLTPQFLFANDEEKKDILTELLNLYIIDKCLDSVKKDEKVMAAKSLELNNDINLYTKSLSELDKDIKYFKGLYEEFEEKRSLNIKELEDKVEKLKSDKVKARSDYMEGISSVSSIEDLERLKVDYEALVIKGVDKDFEKLKSELMGYSNDLKSIRRDIDKFNDLVYKKKCPTCEQEIGSSVADSSIKPLVEREYSLKELEKKAKEEYDRLKKVVDDNDQLRKKISDVDVNIRVTKGILESRKKSFEQLQESLNRHIEDYTKLLDNKKVEKNNYLETIEAKSIKMEETTVLLESKKVALSKAKKYLEAYRILIKSFSREGVKAFVFAKVINELNFYISEYLKKMFDGNINLRFDIQSVGSQGQVKQKIDTILTVDGIRRNINLLSGGERCKVILACNFALSKLISTRNVSVPNFLCLDEVFSGLDSNSMSKVMEFLKELSPTKDFVYIIDHNNTFKEMFDAVYRVEKRGGVSKLCETN